MSKKGIIIGSVLALAVGAGASSFFWYKYDTERLTEANANIEILNATIDNIGQCVPVCTVSSKMRQGEEIKPEDLTTVLLPDSMVTECWVTDPSQVEGMYYKVDMEKGTPLTTDLCMSDQIDDTTRERDICFDYMPVGLQEGDYVDVCLQLPYGEPYTVIPKLRIQEVNDVTVKVLMTEEYWNIYQSALVDYYLHSEDGASIYIAKYVEPGVQEAAIPFYSVRDNIKAVMQLNPNIVELASTALNESLRDSINKSLDAVDVNSGKNNETEKAAILSGRVAYQDNVNSDYTSKKEEREAEEEAQAEAEEQAEAEAAQSTEVQEEDSAVNQIQNTNE